MKSQAKRLIGYEWVLVFIIITPALFLRFYNFTNRITFGPEQAISLMTSGEYIKGKLSLIGQGNLIRINSKGLKLFSGSLFNYSLVPLMLAFNYNPIPITGYFVFLNIVTGLALYLIARKMFGRNVAFLSLIIFLFNDYMIYHSLFIWILNYMPLLSIGVIYLLFLYKSRKRMIYPFLLGVLSGIGIGLEYFYILTFVGTLFLMIYWSKNKIRDMSCFFLGALLGNFPYVVFDLRHGFYQTQVLLQYVKDIFSEPSQAKITYYHFLQFWPLVILYVSYILDRIIKRKIWIGVLLTCYIVLMFFSKRVDFNKPTGMSAGLTTEKVLRAAQIISNDNPRNFNLAVLLDFDTRGHILRYPLEYIYGKKPLGVENYQDADELYVLAGKNFDFKKPQVWELKVFSPYKVKELKMLDTAYGVYKLTK